MTLPPPPPPSTTHQSLADFVKGVHAHLRRRVQDGVDSDKVWDEHVQLEKSMRDQYASSMHDLATNHWDNSENSESSRASRIEWVRKNVCLYFYGAEEWELIDSESSLGVVYPNSASFTSERSGLFAAICKDIRRDLFNAGQLKKDVESGRPLLSEEDAARVSSDGRARWKRCLTSAHWKSAKSETAIVGLPLRLLDVGSCFDPFGKFNAFQTLAIDISPATDSVVEMDYIKVEVTKSEENIGSSLSYCSDDSLGEKRQCIQEKSFHVVVFSLLLEYFPSPRQRWTCCWKANKVLTLDGVLVIITPDSSHVNKRAAQMKSWQNALETHLGFKRWKYEKLTHLHCMIYRKVADVEDLTSSFHDSDELSTLLYIPQDTNQSGTTPVDFECY